MFHTSWKPMPEMQKECVSVRSAKRSSGVVSSCPGWKRQRLTVYLFVFSLYRRDVPLRKAHDLAQAVKIHAGDDHRHQEDAHARLFAVFNGLELDVQHLPAADGAVYAVVQAVELEVYEVEPRVAQPLKELRLPGYAYAKQMLQFMLQR